MAADQSAGGASFTRRTVIQLTGAAAALPAVPSESKELENWRMLFTPKFADLVRNTTTTVGTGNLVLGPAVNGFTSFIGAIQPGESFYYSVLGLDKPAEREVGRGTMESNGSISRAPIDGKLTNFTTGSKTVALVTPAEWFNRIEAGIAGGGTGPGQQSAASRAEMAAIASPSAGASCELREVGREGLFVHMTAADFADRYGFPLADAIAADVLQGLYVATGSGAWVRADDRITPFMFGGQTNFKTGNRSTMVPPYGESATPGSINGILVDSRAACQAMIDLVALHKNREFVADFSTGLWGIAKRGDGGAHDLDGLVIDQPGEYPRRFIGGEFRGIGAGVNLIYAKAQYSKLEGIWHIRSGADGGSSYGYNARQWENGIWLRHSSQCKWDEVKTSGFLRWGIEYDPEPDNNNNNNIASRFARVYGNNNGSACDRADAFQIAWTASSRTSVANSFAQRTNWTLAAGHEILRVDDIVRGPNGQYHQIMEKVGNVISVFPWSISTAATGTLTSCHGGAMRLRGPNVAGAGADNLTSVACGASIGLTNILLGTNWGSVIQEGGGLGLLIGVPNGIAGLGHTIAHMHSEGMTLDMLAVGNSSVGLNILAASQWADADYSDPFKLCLSIAPNDGAIVDTATGLPWVALFIEGQWQSTGTTYAGSSVATKSRAFAPALSNNPAHNRIRKVANSLTVTLKYFEGNDRCQRDTFAARVELTGTAGGAPTGALTVNLNAADIAAGITFLGGSTTYTVAAGAATGPMILDFWLDTNGSTLRWIVVPRAGLARESILVAASDETTALTAGTGKATFRMPYAFKLLEVRASLTAAQASGAIVTVDVNEGANSILSTKLTVDNGERTSTTAAVFPIISDKDLADDAEISIDIDQVGDGTAKGLKVMLIGYRP